MLLYLKYLGYGADSNTNKTETMPIGPIFGTQLPKRSHFIFFGQNHMVNQEEMDPNFSFTNVPPEQTIYLLSARKTIRQSFSYLLGFYITKYYKKPYIWKRGWEQK